MKKVTAPHGRYTKGNNTVPHTAPPRDPPYVHFDELLDACEVCDCLV